MLTISLSLLITHFVADFLLQSDWMALNKSKRWDALGLHVAVYSLCFAPWGLRFWLLTFITHFITDAITSRVTSKLWFMQNMGIVGIGPIEHDYTSWKLIPWKRHWFFVVIGLDQLIHYGTLAWSLKLVSF